ncbi:MAG: hypothetical protein ABI594_11710 [Ginsengibacter sp.]
MSLNKMLSIITFFFFSGCTSSKMSLQIPAAFASEAEMTHINKIKKKKLSPELNFGKYQTSPVKQGLVFARTKDETPGGFFWQKTQLLKMARIYEKVYLDKEDNKFHFSISDGIISAGIICTEKYRGKRKITTKPIAGTYSKPEHSEYIFTGTIIPESPMDTTLWQIVIIKYRDPSEKIQIIFFLYLWKQNQDLLPMEMIR